MDHTVPAPYDRHVSPSPKENYKDIHRVELTPKTAVTAQTDKSAENCEKIFISERNVSGV